MNELVGECYFGTTLSQVLEKQHRGTTTPDGYVRSRAGIEQPPSEISQDATGLLSSPQGMCLKERLAPLYQEKDSPSSRPRQPTSELIAWQVNFSPIHPQQSVLVQCTACPMCVCAALILGPTWWVLVSLAHCCIPRT